MSEITVSFTEEEARDFVAGVGPDDPRQDGAFGSISKKIRAALPPEYPEFTVAWVTQRLYGSTYRRIAQRLGGEWVTDTACEIHLNEGSITKIEPIRILADDEIAVKHPGSLYLRPAADVLERRNFVSTADWLRDVADALDAEKK